MTRTRRWIVIALILVLGMAGLLVVPAINWRVRVGGLKLVGSLDAVNWGEMARMMAPNARYHLEDVLHDGTAFSAIRNPFASAQLHESGAVAYAARCAVCHGEEGKGETAPSLASGELRNGATDWALYRTIQRGVPNTPMPAHDLPERELWALVSFVRSLYSVDVADPSGAAAPAPEVTDARILRSLDAGEWLSYSGSYDGRRHSPLAQVDRTNVANLKLLWSYQMSMRYPVVETVPLVAGSTMYFTEPGGGVGALDARTGESLWTYHRGLPGGVKVCCGVVNRGAAIQGNILYVGTTDAHLIALDARNGRVVWDVTVDDFKAGYSFTGAPLVIRDKVIMGVAGGEYGIRGYIDAYDIASGRRLWRFYTVPGPGEPGNDTWAGDSWKTGGSPTWLTGTYDPALNLLYWGVGNPGPDYRPDLRKGDNLYSNSVVALDADTGKLKWHFQFTPSDDRDWDANQIPVLIDADENGAARRLMGWANRNGFYYLLDRQTGKFLAAREYVRQNWAKRIDENGRPVLGSGSGITEGGVLSFPAKPGATNWWSPAYSPTTGLFYVPTIESGAIFSSAPTTYQRGEMFLGGIVQGVEQRTFSIRALDGRTGEKRWEYQPSSQTSKESRRAGVLSTAGGLVISADETMFVALDAKTGKELWVINLGGAIVAAPITYSIDGRQYISIAAGRAIFTFSLQSSR